VSSQLMALGLHTATAGSDSGIFHVRFLYFNCISSYE
jgi:hypothetical protein